MSAITSLPGDLPADAGPPTAARPTFRPTLGGSYYTDDAIFAREQERIFSARWFCAIRTGDLAAPGAFRGCQVARENISCACAGVMARCGHSSTSAGTAARCSARPSPER